MSGWTKKRFWTVAEAVGREGGFTVLLDGRAVKTPAKADFLLPTLALAQAAAAEWDAQGGALDPRTMPVTRGCNAAIDKVVPQFGEVAGMLASYGETDLICYRAEGPASLVQRQAAAWDPLLALAAGWGAPLVVTSGVMHVSQPEESLSVLRHRVSALTPFEIAGFHDLVAMSGSLIIGLAALDNWAEPAELWRLSRIDEDAQAEQWGVDEEAAEVAALKKQAFEDAARFIALCRET